MRPHRKSTQSNLSEDALFAPLDNFIDDAASKDVSDDSDSGINSPERDEDFVFDEEMHEVLPERQSTRKRKRSDFVSPRRRDDAQSSVNEPTIFEDDMEGTTTTSISPPRRRTRLLENAPTTTTNRSTTSKSKRKKRKREYASAILFSKRNETFEEERNRRLRHQREDEAKQQEALRRIEEEERQQGAHGDAPLLSKKWINTSDPENMILLSDLAASTVKPHQLAGLRFLWRAVVEEDSGAILAHAMGLGKSLQTILFIELFLQQNLGKHIMISAPNSVISSWENELQNWGERLKLKHLPQTNLYNFSDYTSAQETKRINLLKDYRKHGGILLISQNIIFQLLGKTRSQKKETLQRLEKRFKKHKKLYTSVFIDPGPDLLVVDEVSTLKNDENLFYTTVSEMSTRKRILLTGTPLQNNLREMYALVTFVRPGYWELEQFRDIFIDPIRYGSLKDSTEAEVRIMKWRSFILVTQLRGISHRENQRILIESLPQKREFVLMVKVTPLQGKLIGGLLRYLNANNEDITFNSTGNERVKDFGGMLKAVAILHKCINSPDLLRRYLLEHKIAYSNSDGVASEDRTTAADDAFIAEAEEEEEAETDDKTEEATHTERVHVIKDESDSDSDIELITTTSTTQEPISLNNDDDDLLTMSIDDITFTAPKKEVPRQELRTQLTTVGGSQHDSKKKRKRSVSKVTRATTTARRAKEEFKDHFAEGQRLYLDMEYQEEYAWAEDVLGANYPIGSFANNTKMQLVYAILEKAFAAGRKVLLFSQYTSTLDVVETFFKKHPINGEYLRPDLTFIRLDGKTPTKKRKQIIELFNDEDASAKVFLLSTKAGGIGLNLQAASVLVLMDITWNPTNDQQALCRSFRFGQTQDVHVYRLVGAGTAEDSIYKKSLNKVWLSRRVVDDEVNKRFLEYDQVFKFKYTGTKEIDQDREIDPTYQDDFILRDVYEQKRDLIQAIYQHEGLYVEDPEGALGSLEEIQESIRDFETATGEVQMRSQNREDVVLGGVQQDIRTNTNRPQSNRTLLDELHNNVFRDQLMRIMGLVPREDLVRVVCDMWNTTPQEANHALDVMEMQAQSILVQAPIGEYTQQGMPPAPTAAGQVSNMATQPLMGTQTMGNSQHQQSQYASSGSSSQRSGGGVVIDLT